eukprot:scaffold127294_cov41-Tisochrysis_lutea.AAC.1
MDKNHQPQQWCAARQAHKDLGAPAILARRRVADSPRALALRGPQQSPIEPKAEVASEAKLPGSGGTRWLFAMLNSGRGVPSSDEPSSSESRPGEASAPREGARDIARDARREA